MLGFGCRLVVLWTWRESCSNVTFVAATSPGVSQLQELKALCKPRRSNTQTHTHTRTPTQESHRKLLCWTLAANTIIFVFSTVLAIADYALMVRNTAFPSSSCAPPLDHDSSMMIYCTKLHQNSYSPAKPAYIPRNYVSSPYANMLHYIVLFSYCIILVY